ncbi:hypothetical protein PV325_003249 [Microctonus aethiopoides]|nr:hypothetical protein PV325_003249 [Microctonus aethiopoides]
MECAVESSSSDSEGSYNYTYIRTEGNKQEVRATGHNGEMTEAVNKCNNTQSSGPSSIINVKERMECDDYVAKKIVEDRQEPYENLWIKPRSWPLINRKKVVPERVGEEENENTGETYQEGNNSRGKSRKRYKNTDTVKNKRTTNRWLSRTRQESDKHYDKGTQGKTKTGEGGGHDREGVIEVPTVKKIVDIWEEGDMKE